MATTNVNAFILQMDENVMQFVYTNTYTQALNEINYQTRGKQIAVAELANGAVLHYLVSDDIDPPLSQAAISIGASKYTWCSPVWISRGDNKPLDVESCHGDPQRFVDNILVAKKDVRGTVSAATPDFGLDADTRKAIDKMIDPDIDADLQERLDGLKRQ